MGLSHTCVSLVSPPGGDEVHHIVVMHDSPRVDPGAYLHDMMARAGHDTAQVTVAIGFAPSCRSCRGSNYSQADFAGLDVGHARVNWFHCLTIRGMVARGGPLSAHYHGPSYAAGWPRT